MPEQSYMSSRDFREFLKNCGLPCGSTWFADAIKSGLIKQPIKIGNRNYWPVTDGPELLATLDRQRDQRAELGWQNPTATDTATSVA